MHITSTTPFKGEAETAWRILMDFSAYEAWNPFVVRADTADRRRVHLWLDPGAEERMLGLDVRIDKTNAPHFLRGALLYGAPGILDGRYNFSIDEAAGTLTQEVKLGGCMRRFYVSDRFGRQLKRGLDAMGGLLAKRAA